MALYIFGSIFSLNCNIPAYKLFWKWERKLWRFVCACLLLCFSRRKGGSFILMSKSCFSVQTQTWYPWILFQNDVPGMLAYSLKLCMSLMQNKQFRNKVLRVLVKIYMNLEKPDFINVCQVNFPEWCLRVNQKFVVFGGIWPDLCLISVFYSVKWNTFSWLRASNIYQSEINLKEIQILHIWSIYRESYTFKGSLGT